ncbi:MAG: UDP-N-acetylglucosamine 1-carboxyvinyltransferase [Patescibacteria group bacterium]|nr:UDP-N-acetylglucosamine 1-carboxyvinyltransferase [Patescibacteria group bacterium]MBU1952978.1 UDP-N-acetylglucosamine 1-carboxyvinyltransferase [Patescibacteria group bacterium]
MPGINVEGGIPLTGSVTVSGAKNSAIKLMYASLFSNEDVVLTNVPRIKSVFDDISIIQSIGGKAEWASNNTLIINGASVTSYEVPKEIGLKYRTIVLLAGPLLFRFGKAVLPKYKPSAFSGGPMNRFFDAWKSLGVLIEEDEDFITLLGEDMKSADIVFKTSSHTATDNAILSSIFVSGETTITNASEECEVDDLINLFKAMGANIERVEPRKIKIIGGNMFKGAKLEVCPDKAEIAAFAVAAVLTKGNISIKGVKRDVMVQFVNFLNKIGVRFDFQNDELKVWRNDETIQPVNIEVSPTPGFVPDWMSAATLVLTQAEGESTIHDTVYVDRFNFVMDLNRMGAKIELTKPSESGCACIISDDSYDFEKLGEPKTVAKISGPSKLKGERLTIEDFRDGAVLLLASLCADGKSEIIGVENIENYFENFVNKLKSLGAKIWEQ